MVSPEKNLKGGGQKENSEIQEENLESQEENSKSQEENSKRQEENSEIQISWFSSKFNSEM